MYKVSIILPTYNVENYIKECFDSLLKQTIGFSNMQIIFVDDCSTDNSCDIIDKYANDYENVISIHLHSNSGFAGKPRNEGMKFSFSDYLLFLDPDDILMPNACEVLYDAIKKSNVDIVVAGYKKQDWIANWRSILNDDESLIENPKDNLSIYFNPPGLSAKIFKRDFIIKNNIQFSENVPAQDLIFLMDSYLNANSILSLNNFIAYEYRVRNDTKNKSITQNITKEYLFNLLEAYTLVLDLFDNHNVNNLLRKLCFTKNHFNFFRVQLNKSKLAENELKELYSSEFFLKFRNQKFILEDESLNKFFNHLIENYESVDGKTIQLICRRTQKDIINSFSFNTEKKVEPVGNILEQDSEIQNIEKELYSFIKKSANLYNSIEDSKK